MAKKSIWDKIDPAMIINGAEGESGSTAQSAAKKTDKEIKRLRRLVLFLDVLGTFWWLYALTKLFVVDINRVVLQAIDPSLLGLLDYQLLVFLALLSAGLYLTRRTGKFYAILYVMFFPLVVIGWKIPRVIYKRKSWMVSIAALNSLVTFVHSFMFYLIAYTSGAIIMVFVAVSSWRPLTIASAAAIAVLTVVLVYRRIATALRKNRFLDMQRRAVVTWIGRLHSFVALQPQLRNPRIKRYSKKQVELIRDRLSIGVVAIKATNFWVHQLDTYRRSGVSTAFAVLSYGWLLIEILIGATFMNIGILRAFDGAFAVDHDPSFLEVMHYTLNALVINSVDYMRPASDVALVLKIALGLAGPLLALTVLIHFVVSHRSARQEIDYQEAASEIRSATMALERKLSADYDLSMNEALMRIAFLGGGFYLVILNFFMAQIPDDTR